MKLSKRERDIPKSVWEELHWTQFESLAYDFLRTKFGTDGWAVERTAEVGPDGGRDLELSCRIGDRPYRVWVECKHHKSPIGLDTIGKSFIVVVANGVDELIVVSSSPITEPAKQSFWRVARMNRLRVSFHDGPDLDRSLHDYPDVVQRHFGAVFPCAPPEHFLGVHVIVSQYFDAFAAEPTGPVGLFEEEFFIHLRLKNHQGSALTVRKVTTPNVPGVIDIRLDALSPALPLTLAPREDAVLTCCARVLVPQLRVSLPDIVVEIENEEDDVSTRNIELPDLDLSGLKTPPLIGERLRTFVKEKLPDLATQGEAGHPRFIDIRGDSGVGKTRLLDEVRMRLRSRGFRTLHYDAMAQQESVFRALLADLMNLPLFRGSMEAAEGKLEAILTARRCDSEFARDLARFLARRADLSDVHYALAETLKQFVRHPVHAAPLMVAIDNVQELSPAALDLIVEVANCLSQEGGKVLFVLATNTEIIDRSMLQPVRILHEQFDAFKPAFHIRYDVQPLGDDDAKLLLYHLLHGLAEAAEREEGVEAEGPVLDSLLAKTGNRPLDLVVTVTWMETEGVVERRRTFDWHVPSFRRFAQFVAEVPADSAQLIAKRLDALRDHSSAEQWSAAVRVIRSLMAFRGRLPESFVASRMRAAADALVARSILRLDRDGVVAGYAAFHDNLYRYWADAAGFGATTVESEEVLDWLHAQHADHRDALLLTELYNLAGAGRPPAEILAAGERMLASTEDGRSPSEIIDAGAEISRVLARTRLAVTDFERYLRIKLRYADALLHQARMDDGLREYDDLAAHIAAGSFLESSDRDSFFHQYTNAKLHTARFHEALEVLEQWEEHGASTPWFRFLQFDRRVVAHNAIGDVAASSKAFDEALGVATNAGDACAESIAWYDRGYLHIHVTHDQPAVIDAFTRSLDAYSRAPLREAWRVIEAHQERSIIDLLRGSPHEALRHVQNGRARAKREHLVLYEIKLLNLLGSCHVALGDLSQARAAFLRGRSLSLTYLNERAYWRAMANLGALQAVDGATEAAYVDLAAAEARLREWLPRARSFVMELPLVANFIAACHDTGRDHEATRAAQFYSHPRVRTWLANLRSRPRRHEREAVGVFHRRGVGFFIS